MFYDAMMLARAVTEARERFIGARVQEPMQTRHDELALIFRRDLPTNALLVSSSPQFGRVCLSARPSGRAQPQPFGLALRKHLRGARLTQITQPGFDRVVRMGFEECEGFGKECTGTLIAEIMGKHGNVVLLDEHEVIVSCAKHVPARMNRYRQTMEGEPYVPPPDFGKIDPREVTEEALAARIEAEPDASPRDLIVRACTGISKVMSAEILATLPELPERAETLDDSRIRDLVATLHELPRAAAAPGPSFIYSRPVGTDLPRRFAYPVRLACCDEPLAEHPHLGAAVEPVLQHEDDERKSRELRQRVEGAASAQIKDLSRRLTRLKERIAKAKRDERLRRTGELMLSQPHAAEPYAREIEIVDYYTEGAPTITVELNPPGDLHGTAQTLFDRYKRAMRIQKRVPPLAGKVAGELEYLESVRAEIELAGDHDDLLSIEHELTDQGYLKPRQRGAAKPTRGRRPASKLKSRTSRDGVPILYGTNHLQNDELVRVAAPDDIWLHVQGAPGSHVLIRTSGRPDDIPRSTIVEAAKIAATWSRLKNQDAVDVDYTRAKWVRKQKGERPGMVFYTHQKTLTVRVSE